MPTDVIIKGFKPSELEGAAKDRAYQWLSEAQTDYEWWDFVYEDADAIAKILGIDLNRKGKHTPEIWFSGFWSQGDGACIGGSYSYAKGCSKRIREYAPHDSKLHELADDLTRAQRRAFYRLEAVLEANDRYMSTRVQVYNREDQYADVDRESEELIVDAIRDFANWIYRTLEDEYEHLTSEEVLTEFAESNEYLFDSSGRII